MATWTVRVVDEQVLVMHRVGEFVQECGRSDRALLVDVETWVIDQAQPCDVVNLHGVSFVRQDDRFATHRA